MYSNIDYGDYPSSFEKPRKYRHADFAGYAIIVAAAVVFIILAGVVLT